MGVAEIIQRISQQMFARRTELVSDYVGMVKALADGHEPDEQELLALLEATGKTLDDLANDVGVEGDRRRFAAIVARKPGLLEQLRRIDERSAELREKYLAAEKVFRETGGELNDAKLAVVAELAQVMAAEEQLQRTCVDPLLLERRRQLIKQSERLAAAERGALLDVRPHGTGEVGNRRPAYELAGARARLSRGISRGRRTIGGVEPLRAEVARQEEAVARAQQRLADIRARQAETNQALVAINDELKA